MRFNVYREADSLLDLYKSDFQVKCIVAPISILGLIIAALVVFLRHKELWQLGVLRLFNLARTLFSSKKHSFIL